MKILSEKKFVHSSPFVNVRHQVIRTQAQSFFAAHNQNGAHCLNLATLAKTRILDSFKTPDNSWWQEIFPYAQLVSFQLILNLFLSCWVISISAQKLVLL